MNINFSQPYLFSYSISGVETVFFSLCFNMEYSLYVPPKILKMYKIISRLFFAEFIKNKIPYIVLFYFDISNTNKSVCLCACVSVGDLQSKLLKIEVPNLVQVYLECQRYAL